MRALAVVACLATLLLSDLALAAATDHDRLAVISARAEARDTEHRGAAFEALRRAPSAPMATLLADSRLDLIGVLPNGRPLFLIFDNLDAAVTVATSPVWPGGATGLELDGANANGELAIWDGGAVRVTHREFGGRVIIMDGYATESSHATHVAGTMMAAGMVAGAKGMSPAATLFSYQATGDVAEMAAAAARGLLVSNHSYGIIAGWFYGYGGNPDWYWFGDTDVSELEDPSFGFYGDTSAAWDAIAHAAPHYLICKSAGNDRSDQGPRFGDPHYVWSDPAGDWVVSTTGREPDGGFDGFDSIPRNGVAKNLLTVGAVYDIPGGWSDPSDVVVAGFSCWGPADDGRIKPDLVANGIDLYSPIATSDAAYDSYSGTSTSTPNASGSLNLLVQQYKDLHGGQPMLASTLKAVVLHTAHEAGPAPGPDYMFGWGLLNTTGAAQLIFEDAVGFGGRLFVEAVLDDGRTDTYLFQFDGAGLVKATIVWTDVPGTPPPWSLDPPTSMLVNDLDLVLVRESDGAVFSPWVLDPTDPAAAATTGANHRDNVEVIEVFGAPAGTYELVVSHSGGLRGSQAYSLVVSGLMPDETTGIDQPVVTAQAIQVAPNPFNPHTTLTLAIDRPGPVRVEVFDTRGRRVAMLYDGSLAVGQHELGWDGCDDSGQAMPTGVYLVRMQTNARVDHRRVALIR